MNKTLRADIEEAVGKTTGTPAKVVSMQSAGGGCINNASVLDLEDGRRFFLKWNPSPLPKMFEREAEGLQALADTETLRVPRPVCTAIDLDSNSTPFIVMEYVHKGKKGKRFFETFGHQFAQLHQKARSDRFGFRHDNYLGSTPQPNTWKHDWVEFWRESRLGHQLQLARENGLSDARFNRLGDNLLNRLDHWIGEPDEPPCLLHGDLWGGNYLSDDSGNPVLIDPAAYYGRREADLAMTLLFGGFDRAFYDAYREAWPLADGSDARLDIYKLYHLLNHLNLFGSSYRGNCMSILNRYAGE